MCSRTASWDGESEHWGHRKAQITRALCRERRGLASWDPVAVKGEEWAGPEPARRSPAPPPLLSAPALAPPRPFGPARRLRPRVTSLARPAGAILKVESPAPAAAAAVAVVAAAGAAKERARAGKHRSEICHPADWSARPSFLLPRPPPPPPTGAIRRHPPSLPPHPQVRGVSSGSRDPEEPSRVTICSATWQVKEKLPSATDKAPLPSSSLHHPLATACASRRATGRPLDFGELAKCGGVRVGRVLMRRVVAVIPKWLLKRARTLAWMGVGCMPASCGVRRGWGGVGASADLSPLPWSPV